MWYLKLLSASNAYQNKFCRPANATFSLVEQSRLQRREDSYDHSQDKDEATGSKRSLVPCNVVPDWDG